MKIIGVPLIATISLTAILTAIVVRNNSQSSPKILSFEERLSSIASEVNSAQTTWKANPSSIFAKLTKE